MDDPIMPVREVCHLIYEKQSMVKKATYDYKVALKGGNFNRIDGARDRLAIATRVMAYVYGEAHRSYLASGSNKTWVHRYYNLCQKWHQRADLLDMRKA